MGFNVNNYSLGRRPHVSYVKVNRYFNRLIHMTVVFMPVKVCVIIVYTLMPQSHRLK